MNQNTEKYFVKLIHENEGIIYKVAFIYADGLTDREDLYQEIVLQAWKGFSNFKGHAAFSTWLYQVALNTAIIGFKKQQRMDAVFIHVETLPDHYEQGSNDSREEQLAMLKQAISTLNDIEKAVIILFLEGQTYEKMELITGISSGALRVKMNRIKEKLRNITKQKSYGN